MHRDELLLYSTGGKKEITVQYEHLGLGGALYDRKVTLYGDTNSKNSTHLWCTERNVTSETWNVSQLLSSYLLLAQVSFWHKVAAPSVFALQ